MLRAAALRRPLDESGRYTHYSLRHLEAKERTAKYVGECAAMLKRVFDEGRFVVWSDITPGRVETYLKGLRDGGLSVRRSNGYLTALKGFIRWMIDTGQANESPLRGLRKLNEKIDVRRERRAATPEGLRKLIATTAVSGESFDLDGLTVRVRAGYSKHREMDSSELGSPQDQCHDRQVYSRAAE